MSDNNEIPKWAESIVESNKTMRDALETMESERDQAKALEAERQAALVSEQAKPGEDMSEAVRRFAERKKQGYEGEMPGRDISEDPVSFRNRAAIISGGRLGGKEI